MTDKVQLIKEEIVRRRKSLPKETEHEGLMAVYGGIAYELTELLQFIDSLPEEHNEDLENQYKSNIRYQHTYTQDDLMKTKSEDLEEYYKKEFLPKEWFAKPGQRTISQFNFFTARHFAEWQKQQMMKDAVEGVIDIRKWPAKAQVEFYDRLPDFDVRTGYKVKIIIVKEEQQ